MVEEDEAGGDSANEYRRRFLLGVGAAGIAGVSAGCLGGSDDPDEDDEGNTDEDGADDEGSTDDEVDDGEDEPTASANFTVLDLQPGDDTLARGEPLEVVATIENGGDGEGTQDVELRVDDESADVEEVTLDVGEAEQIDFEAIDTLAYDPGEYAYEVTTEDDDASATLTIGSIFGDEPDPLLVFDDDEIALETGEQTVSATLENPYEFAVESGEVTFEVPDGWEVTGESGTTFDTLENEDAQDVEWEISVPDDAEGEYEFTGSVTYAASGEEADVAFERLAYLPVDVSESVAYRWELSEGEGETTTDSVSGLEMALDSPEWQSGAGADDYYLAFDGDSDRGVAAHQDDFDDLDAITVNFWFRTDDGDPDDYNNFVAVNASSGTTSAGDLAWNVANNPNNGNIEFRLSDGSAGYGDSDLEDGAEGIEPSAYADGAWHMVTCVWDGGEERHELYLDGDLHAEVTTTVSSMDAIEEELTIGATQDGGRARVGEFDFVEIAPNEAWRSAEIAGRYDERQEHY